MQLFGGAPEFRDARPNFDSFGYSFLSVFEILTGSHWYKLTVIAMSGSKGGPAALFFIVWSFIGTLVLLNLVSGMLIDALSRVAKERELELARIAEEKLEQDRREQEEKRDADIKKFLLVKGLDDKTSSTQVVADEDDLGADSNSLRTLVKAKEIRQHPDAKRIIDRINTRKQRKSREKSKS
jgi:Ion transport protein.